jgi:hypothetical protein
MTRDGLLVLTVKGCGILKITPISPAMSQDPSFNKNWKKGIILVLSAVFVLLPNGDFGILFSV